MGGVGNRYSDLMMRVPRSAWGRGIHPLRSVARVIHGRVIHGRVIHESPFPVWLRGRARVRIMGPMFKDNGSAFKRSWLLLCVVALVLTACQVPSVPAEPAPTPTATVTPGPTATPTVPPAWLERDTYRAAMLASAADEVELLEAPTFYNIEAFLDAEDDPPRIYALQDTRYTNGTGVPVERLYFRLFPNKPSFGSALTFEEVSIAGQEVELVYEAENTAVGLLLAEPLQPWASVDVHMAYDVTVPVDNARGYGTFNYEDGVFVLSNFYAMAAVYDDEGWDLSLAPDYGDPVYAESSFYQVELTVPEEMVVVTSGSTLEQVKNDGDSSTWRCVSGPMRDFMIVASERFVSSSMAVGFVRLKSYYLPEHEQAGEAALGYARDCLRAYQQSFGPYPFAEFDVVEAPISAGGMEYPGLVIIDDGQYANLGAYTEFVVAHEVAHQWWYSLVGNDQVNVPWLDESLTNFSVVYYYENTYGRSQADLAFESYIASRYEGALSRGRDGVVFQAVADFEPQDYGPIVYGKGAVFFYELREALGDALFLDVLQAYLQDRKYKLSTPDDLLRVAEQVSGQELDPLYEQWILSAE